MASDDLLTTAQGLTFEHVSYAYDRAPVIEDVSATIAQGAMVGLLGPNGAGKSTLLRLASGVLSPSSGRVLVGSRPARGIARGEMARLVAFVPQDFSVQFEYTVRQIVELGRLPYGGLLGGARAVDSAAVDAALDITHTASLSRRIFNELSGGERQRVLIALALAQEGGLLLLDEPTAHLDIKHQIEVLELVRRLNHERGLTVIAALHDLNLAARYFPRLLLLRRGIVADGPPAHVLDSALLSATYEIPVQVGILRGEEHLSVLPPAYHAPTSASALYQPPSAPVAHVLAGGGSGELVMRALADASAPFSAGPLNVGDSDYALAERLAVSCIAEPPHAPVSPQGLAACRERLAATRVVVVCPMPLGHGNVALLDAARAAQQEGVRIILLDPAVLLDPAGGAEGMLARVAQRDFSGRGSALYVELLAGGATWATSAGDVVRQVGAVGP